MNWMVRAEHVGDHAAIRDVTQRAFAPMSFADGHDHEIVGRFRKWGRLRLSLVAEHEGKIIGHVAFSRMLGDAEWFALGPIAVEPALQKRGIGSAMIDEGCERLRDMAAAGVCLMGDPAYYSRFGFVVSPEQAPENEPPQYFQMLNFAGLPPRAKLAFDPLFYGDA